MFFSSQFSGKYTFKSQFWRCYQGDRLWIVMFFTSTGLHLYSISILSISRGKEAKKSSFSWNTTMVQLLLFIHIYYPSFTMLNNYKRKLLMLMEIFSLSMFNRKGDQIHTGEFMEIISWKSMYLIICFFSHVW